MNTLSKNSEDYKKGNVTESGFIALREAELYDQASAISACAARLKEIKLSLNYGVTLKLFVPNGQAIETDSLATFESWAKKYFPVSIGYLSKYGT